MYDLIIIGGDSAGLAAGIYAGRKKMKTLILTEKLGGQSLFTDSIENYPGFLEISGIELVTKFKSQVDKFGAEFKDSEKVGSVSKEGNTFTVKTEKGDYNSKSIIIATGSQWKRLGVIGEEKFISKGVSFCAICDAPFYSGKDVAVVGGGNSALDSAYDLLDYAKKIYILQHREKFKGDKAMIDKLKESGKVEFLTSAKTKEIKGDKFVEGLVYEDLKTKETKELKVGGVFVNIGQVPNSSFVKDLVDLNERKEIIIDHKTNSTSLEGAFAAGDVSDVVFKQSIIASAEGVKSTLSAYEYLKNN
ncbi:NAD(P)/FAD-dependent oxidoreductase [Patescibacteria group bacterium]